MKKVIGVAIGCIVLFFFVGCQNEAIYGMSDKTVNDNYNVRFPPGPPIVIGPGGGGDFHLTIGQYWFGRIYGNAGIFDVSYIGSSPADVVVMKPENFHRFKNWAQFTFNPAGTKLDIIEAHYGFELFEDGELYIVVNNSGGIPGGAVPEGPLTFDLTVWCNGTLLDSDTGNR
jgi:hypothetical protein